MITISTLARMRSILMASEAIAPLRIVESPHATKQWRFPRTKKRRIRKKWQHRAENREPAAYISGNFVVIHPSLAPQLRERLTACDSKALDVVSVLLGIY